MFFNGPYLRVLTPKTVNGVNPKIGVDGRVEYREAHLPLSAKQHIERLNSKTPDHLKKKIEVVNPVAVNNGYVTIESDTEVVAMKEKIAALEAENETLHKQRTGESGLFGKSGEQGTKTPNQSKATVEGSKK